MRGCRSQLPSLVDIKPVVCLTELRGVPHQVVVVIEAEPENLLPFKLIFGS